MQLLMVHGSGQNELTYHYQTAQFANADAVNLPGHPDGQPRDSIAGYVDWLREYAVGNGYPPFVLFGHSMGGAIALDYALRFPQDLAGLVLIGTGARLRVHPDYLNRCLDDAQWRAEAPAYYEAINPEPCPATGCSRPAIRPHGRAQRPRGLRQIRRDGTGQGNRHTVAGYRGRGRRYDAGALCRVPGP